MTMTNRKSMKNQQLQKQKTLKRRFMAALPTQDEIQAEFREATDQKIPHYSVQFPEWLREKDKPVLVDSINGEPEFDLSAHPLKCVTNLNARLGYLKGKYPKYLKRITAKRPVEDVAHKGEEEATDLSRMPHPDSNFDHEHPDKMKVGGPVPAGLQRLKLVFEWVLCQVTTLFGEINAALDDDNRKTGQQKYDTARKNYIALLKDLDDHEPRAGMLKPGMSGYGRAIKWAFILPLIHEGRIKGVKVVAKWNPHISSSGIPIPHA